jgi:hypothetical protein
MARDLLLSEFSGTGFQSLNLNVKGDHLFGKHTA